MQRKTKGVLAQLVERLNGIQKVRSSILLCSTRERQHIDINGCRFFMNKTNNAMYTTGKHNSFWREIGIIIIGTTISILLTIGSSQLLEKRQRAKDRELTAMMVLSNIESSARQMEDMSVILAQIDTIGAWLLAQPVEKLELIPDDDFKMMMNEINYEIDWLESKLKSIPIKKVLYRMGFPDNYRQIAYLD